MATKRKVVKIDDCQRTLSLKSPVADVGAMTVQVPDLLARANRRQYEQCRAYDVQVQIGMEDSGSTRNYEIYTLSNAWWVKRSIEMAKGVYMSLTEKERALLGDRRGKWNDFIIETGAAAASQNFANIEQYEPATSGDDMTASEVTTDETIYEDQTKASELEGDQDLGAEIEYGFTVGATDETGGVRSYNIFDQYMLTRQHVTPADTRDAPYESLLGLDHSAMDNLKQDGDNAPYDLDAFPSPWVLADVIGYDANPSHVTRTVSRMVTAPLGCVIIKKKSLNSDTNLLDDEQILLHVRKGTYKGVHAPAYRAMKL